MGDEPRPGLGYIAALLVGLLPVGFGLPWWLALPFSALVVVAGLYVLGKRVREQPAGSPEPAPELTFADKD